MTEGDVDARPVPSDVVADVVDDKTILVLYSFCYFLLIVLLLSCHLFSFLVVIVGVGRRHFVLKERRLKMPPFHPLSSSLLVCCCCCCSLLFFAAIIFLAVIFGDRPFLSKKRVSSGLE